MANNRSIQTTATVFAIVEALVELEGPTLSEIAEHVDLAKSTVHKHLAALQDAEYVVKEGDRYYVGLRFLRLGVQRKRSYAIVEVTEKNMQQLAAETGEAVWFVVEEYGQAVNLHNVKGDRAVQTLTDIGDRIPMHQSAGGKSILAHLPDDRVDEIVAERGLPKRTENTVTSRAELEAELEAVRERGYGVDDKEIVSNVRAIAAPILYQGEPLGAVSISGPAHRFTGDFFEERLPDLLLGATNEIELRLEFEDEIEL
jgi:DNA-binding IclR family transcriptional regulator